MFFFIAGIQPKTVDLDSHPRRCSSCGLYQARLIRVDHYFSLFFIPFLRVKKGTPFIQCDSCRSVFRESGEAWHEPPERPAHHCPQCGEPADITFRFCPRCGGKIP